MSEKKASGTSAGAASSPALPANGTDLGSGGGSTSGASGLQGLRGTGLARNLGLIFVLVVMCVAGVVTSGGSFLSSANIMVILSQAATVGIMAIGMTFIITAGGIDLSVGSVLGLATVWATTLATQNLAEDTHWLLIAVTAVVVGAAAGLLNGIIIAYGRVVSFIATLAMLVGARGLAEIISDRQTQLLDSQSFLSALRGDILGVPVIVWMFVVVAVLGWILFNRTTFGRRTIAVGGNPEAARLAGIKVQRHMMYVFTLGGTAVGIAAITMLARTRSGSSTNGMLYELDVIAAVVVGGTLLIGGRGTIVGTVLGVLIFATLTNLFIQNNLSTSAQSLAKGAIIVLAVLLQQRFASRGSS